MQIHAVCEYIKHDYIVLWLFISSSWLFHVFEQTPELLECNLAVPVGVQLGHQLVQLLLAHVAAPELAQFAGVNWPGVIFVNRLRENLVIS